jgi:hypothetical protein
MILILHQHSCPNATESQKMLLKKVSSKQKERIRSNNNGSIFYNNFLSKISKDFYRYN